MSLIWGLTKRAFVQYVAKEITRSINGGHARGNLVIIEDNIKA